MGKKSRGPKIPQVRARTRPDVDQDQLQQRPPAPRPTVPAVPRGNQRWDSLAALSSTVEQVRSLEARRDRQALQARSQGATWTDIAAALGVSPQAVQQRYGKRASTPPDGR